MMEDVKAEDLIDLARIAMVGASAARGDVAFRFGMGSAIALLDTLEGVLAGRKPTALPTYEDGLRAYLEATQARK